MPKNAQSTKLQKLRSFPWSVGVAQSLSIFPSRHQAPQYGLPI